MRFDEEYVTKLEARAERLADAGAKLAGFVEAECGSCEILDEWDKAMEAK